MHDETADRARARALQAMDLDAHLADPELKQAFVTPMFDVIAPRYDRFTRVFSFGMDRGWKREIIDEIARIAPPAPIVLDLACGTGDLALDVATRFPSARVTGIDASRAMIDLAEVRRKSSSAAGRMRFAVGDMSKLELPDLSVDIVTAGYAFRNVPDHRRALAEVARVLRPGGWLVTLDFHRPENPLWRTLLIAYLTIAGSIIGWLWHRAPVVYAYLGPSVEHFVSWQGFSTSLEKAGFVVEGVSRKLLGGIAIHRARKRDA